MTLGREASEEGDKTSHMLMILAATTSSVFLVVGKKVVGFQDEKEVVVLLKAQWVPKKKNHCNDATEGNRGSCAELERQN